ncbi:toprim domain-containing protein [bacterium]|nr:toprim domain-containing protein [bacterium]
MTEAPIDALSLALAQMPAIALCGTSGLPSWLVTRMAKPAAPGRSRTVYLAFDADPAGDAAAAKIEGQLSLVHCARLRPQSAKGWNAMLSTQGLDSLRQMPEIARLPVKNDPNTTPAANPQKSQNTAIPYGKCSVCGGDVVLHSFESGEGWYWYECEGCGEAGTVEAKV